VCLVFAAGAGGAVEWRDTATWAGSRTIESGAHRLAAAVVRRPGRRRGSSDVDVGEGEAGTSGGTVP
jgi:hypothetical protein